MQGKQGVRRLQTPHGFKERSTIGKVSPPSNLVFRMPKNVKNTGKQRVFARRNNGYTCVHRDEAGIDSRKTCSTDDTVLDTRESDSTIRESRLSLNKKSSDPG